MAVFVLAVCGTGLAIGQPPRKTPGNVPTVAAAPVDLKGTPAYAEVALRRTEIEADLESMLVEFTDEFPRVRELRFALERVKAAADRLLALPANQTGKTTTALGKLLARKVDAEVELWKFQQALKDEHPDVKRAKRKVEIFERAIKEILG